MNFLIYMYHFYISPEENANNTVFSFRYRQVLYLNPWSVNPTKWSNTETIRQQIADELFECV